MFLTWLLKNRQYVLGAAVVLALVAFYNIHVHGLIAAAEVKATTTCNTSWQEAEQQALTRAAKAAHVREEAHTQALLAVQAQARKDINDAKTQAAKDVAAARAGTIRLRDPSAPSTGTSNATTATTTPGGGDDAKRGQLSGEATEFLLTLANEADAITKQLTACQAVVRSYQKECSK